MRVVKLLTGLVRIPLWVSAGAAPRRARRRLPPEREQEQDGVMTMMEHRSHDVEIGEEAVAPC